MGEVGSVKWEARKIFKKYLTFRWVPKKTDIFQTYDNIYVNRRFKCFLGNVILLRKSNLIQEPRDIRFSEKYLNSRYPKSLSALLLVSRMPFPYHKKCFAVIMFL